MRWIHFPEWLIYDFSALPASVTDCQDRAVNFNWVIWKWNIPTLWIPKCDSRTRRRIVNCENVWKWGIIHLYVSVNLLISWIEILPRFTTLLPGSAENLVWNMWQKQYNKYLVVFLKVPWIFKCFVHFDENDCASCVDLKYTTYDARTHCSSNFAA